MARFTLFPVMLSFLVRKDAWKRQNTLSLVSGETHTVTGPVLTDTVLTRFSSYQQGAVKKHVRLREEQGQTSAETRALVNRDRHQLRHGPW